MSKKKNGFVVRFIHWGVALSVLLNAFILETGSLTHRYLGYTAVSLVLIRVLLAKKLNFDHYNPKAEYVYWSIWACIGVLGGSGYMMEMDQFFGNQKLETLHYYTSNTLLFLVSLHLVGIFTDAWIHRRKTWMVMISGRRQ